jgi:hypothetical protein
LRSAKKAPKDVMERLADTMMTQDSLIKAGLNIDTNMALDFILLQVKRATISFQRQLKALEKDALADLEKQIEAATNNKDTSEEELENLEQQHWEILQEICEREATKLKNLPNLTR